MDRENRPLAIFIGIGAAFSWHLSAISEIASFVVFALVIVIGVVVSSSWYGKKPFRAVGHIIFGVFIGTVLDILIFSTVNGYERNLFPIEIVMSTIFVLIISSFVGVILYIYYRVTNAT